MPIDLSSELSMKIINYKFVLYKDKSTQQIAKELNLDVYLVSDVIKAHREFLSGTRVEEYNRVTGKNITEPQSIHSKEFVIKSDVPPPTSVGVKSKLTPFPFDAMPINTYFDLISVAEFNRCNKAVQHLRKQGDPRSFRVSRPQMRCWRTS